MDRMHSYLPSNSYSTPIENRYYPHHAIVPSLPLCSATHTVRRLRQPPLRSAKRKPPLRIHKSADSLCPPQFRAAEHVCLHPHSRTVAQDHEAAHDSKTVPDAPIVTMPHACHVKPSTKWRSASEHAAARDFANVCKTAPRTRANPQAPTKKQEPFATLSEKKSATISIIQG